MPFPLYLKLQKVTKYWTRCWKKIAWFSFYIFNMYITKYGVPYKAW